MLLALLNPSRSLLPGSDPGVVAVLQSTRFAHRNLHRSHQATGHSVARSRRYGPTQLSSRKVLPARAAFQNRQSLAEVFVQTPDRVHRTSIPQCHRKMVAAVRLPRSRRPAVVIAIREASQKVYSSRQPPRRSDPPSNASRQPDQQSEKCIEHPAPDVEPRCRRELQTAHPGTPPALA